MYRKSYDFKVWGIELLKYMYVYISLRWTPSQVLEAHGLKPITLKPKEVMKGNVSWWKTSLVNH